MIINDLDGYYIVFDTKNWNTELDTLFNLLYYLYKIHIVDGIFANSDFNLFDSSFQKKYPNFYALFNNKRLIRLWHKQNRCFCYKMVLKIYSFIQQLKSKL